METMEELILGPKDHHHNYIVKGKRTKRQRPHSPIPFTTPTATTSSTTAAVGELQNATNILSPSDSSSDQFITTTTTKEEEDMANCLILLAQGHRVNPTSPKEAEIDMYKFSSKKYIEASGAAGSGKAGFYVYQCKTCGRNFPSFQALGGHRASHKKPKAEDKKPNNSPFSDDEDIGNTAAIKRDDSSISLHLSHNKQQAYYGNSIGKYKIHECSICGAEFSSGQALGGHMRRHRGATLAAAAATNTSLSLSPTDTNTTTTTSIEMEEAAKRPKTVLSLDLNLPAPEDHDQQNQRESKFGGFAKKQQEQQQQSDFVLSTAPSLVDCHY